MDDHQLLALYVNEGSHDAFAEIIRRHVNLVYSTALRRVGTTQLAEDVTQIVFANLARKAKSISSQVILAGWLHRDTRFTAIDMLRTENRRRAREQEALAMNTLAPDSDPDWQQIRPLLDEALDQLNPADRDALLLRFFEQRSLKEIGLVMGSGEEAARKRVTRALDKLRAWLIRRGVGASAAALSIALTNNAVHAAPVGLAAAIASSAATLGASAAGVATIAELAITMTKLKTGIISALMVVAVATPLVLQYRAQIRLRYESDALRKQTAEIEAFAAENERLSNELAEARNAAPLTDAQLAELRRLRAEVTSLRGQRQTTATNARPPDTATNASNPVSPPASPNLPMMPKERWNNVGNNSPFATLETLYWSAANHNADVFSQTVAWDSEFKAEAEAMFAAAPESVRQRFGSVDGVLYAMISSPKMMSGIAAIGVASEEMQGDRGTLMMQYQRTDGRTGESPWEVQRFEDGSWRLIFGSRIRTEVRDILANPNILN